jgi:hypothetical protein
MLSTPGKRIRGTWNYRKGVADGTIYNKDTFAVTLNDGVAFYDSKGLVRKIKIENFNLKRLVYVDRKVIYVDDNNYVNYYTPAGQKKMFGLNIQKNSNPTVYNNGVCQ